MAKNKVALFSGHGVVSHHFNNWPTATPEKHPVNNETTISKYMSCVHIFIHTKITMELGYTAFLCLCTAKWLPTRKAAEAVL